MPQVNYNDPNNYKKCKKKQYEIHVCMPPKDTVVINKLEQADTVKLLNGKTYFTVEELQRMQKNGDGRFNLITQAVNAGKAYLVNDKTPFVLAGTLGELWTISAGELASQYQFLQNNQPVMINQQTLNQRLSGGWLDWTLVRTMPNNSQAWACFVPTAQKGQIQSFKGTIQTINGVGVSHGKGDFVIAQDVGNKPNLVKRYVVNGDIFATTYNNQGWTDCLSPNLSNRNVNLSITELPKLNSSVLKNNDLDTVDFNKLDIFILDTIYSEAKAKGIYKTFNITAKKSIEDGDTVNTIKLVHKISGTEHNFTIAKGLFNVKLWYAGYVRLSFRDSDDLHIKKVKPKIIQVFVEDIAEILKEEKEDKIRREKNATLSSIKEFLSADFSFGSTQISGNAKYGSFEETTLLSNNNNVFVRTCRVNVKYCQGGNWYDDDKEDYTTIFESVEVPISLFKENKEEFRRRILKSSGRSDIGKYGSHEYWLSLNSEEKQKEIYDPQSPYYGRTGS